MAGLRTWGRNNYGQLGLGDTTTRSVPTQVGTDTDWATIAAGYSHTLALFLVAPPSETETIDADTRIVIYSPITRLADASVSVGTVETVTADGSVTAFSSLSLLADASVAVYVPEALAADSAVTVFHLEAVEADALARVYVLETVLADTTVTVTAFDLKTLLADTSLTVYTTESVLADHLVSLFTPEALVADLLASVGMAEALAADTSFILYALETLLADALVEISHPDLELAKADALISVHALELLEADVSANIGSLEITTADVSSAVYTPEILRADAKLLSGTAASVFADTSAEVYASESVTADAGIAAYSHEYVAAHVKVAVWALGPRLETRELYGRETLTYAPHFRYVVDLVLSDAADQVGQAEPELELPQSVREFMEAPPSTALKDTEDTLALLRDLIAKIEARLVGDARVVDDKIITFAQYKAAVESESPTDEELLLIRAYEFAHLEVDGDPAVLLYRQLKSLAEDLLRFYGTLTTEAQKLQGDARDLESAEADLLQNWISLEREAFELDRVIAEASSVPNFGDELSEVAERAQNARRALARLDYERVTKYDTPSRQLFRVAEAQAMMLGAHLRLLDAALGIDEAQVWQSEFDNIAVELLKVVGGAERVADKLDRMARLLETANRRISNILVDITSSVASAMLAGVRQVLYEGPSRISSELMEASDVFDCIEVVAELGSVSPTAELFANLLLDAIESYKRALENLLLDLKRGQMQMAQRFKQEITQVGQISQARAAARILRKIASAIRRANRKLKLDDEGEARRFLEAVAASNGWARGGL